MFPFAPQPDLYRSAQKDDAVLHKLRDDFSDLALQLGGQRWAHRQAELDLLASAAYYGLTQLRGGTTLGEEYCDLLMVAEQRTRNRQAAAGETLQHSPPALLEEKQSTLDALPAAINAVQASQSLLTSSPTSASSSSLATSAALPIASAASLSAPSSSSSSLTIAPPTLSSLVPTTTSFSSSSPLFTSNWHLPSGRHRACLFLLQVVLPYLYVKAKKHQQTMLPPPAQPPHLHHPITPTALYHRSLALLPSIDALLPHLHRLHLALFFLSARYVSLAHRVAGLRFVHLRVDVADSRPSYTGLGVLLIVQLAATAAVKAWQAVDGWRERKRRREEEGARGTGQGAVQVRNAIQQRMAEEKVDEADESSSDESNGAPQCILHLGPVRHATATECGHVYCWSCIAECCKQKPECPLCRTPITLDNLLLLVNYT